MRVIDLSGGIKLGQEKGPWLDIIPVRPSASAERSAEERYLLDANWASDSWLFVDCQSSEHRYMLPPGTKYGLAFCSQRESLMVRLSWKRGKTIDALRHIVRHENDEVALPASLLWRLYAAARGRDKGISPRNINLVSFLFASSSPPIEGGSLLSKKERSKALELAMKGLDERKIDFPRSAWSSAEVAWQVGRLLWRDSVRQVLPLLNSSTPAGRWLALIATVVFLVEERGKLPTSSPLAAPEGSEAAAWPQFLALLDAPAEVVVRLFPKGRIAIPGDAIGENLDPEPVGLKSDLLEGIASSLIEEAETRGRFVPLGAFELVLPPCLPWDEWGYSAMRIVADPEGMWVGLVRHDGETAAALRWTPAAGTPNLVLLLPEWARSPLNATCAAIWRDMTCAAEVLVEERPAERRKRGRRSRSSLSRSTLRQGSERTHRVRAFPRRKVEYGGRRLWGEEDERRRIENARLVCGHYRAWMPPPDADPKYVERMRRGTRLRAQTYGFPFPPKGYTFVRPHSRGGKKNERELLAEKAGLELGEHHPVRKMRAKGLAALAVAFRSR